MVWFTRAGLSRFLVTQVGKIGGHTRGPAMKSDFLIALTQLAAERHLPKEQVLQAIEVALASAFKKDNPVTGQNISVKLNPNTGDVSVFALKTVVDEVEDPDREIGFSEAQKIRSVVTIGDEVALPERLPHNASRIAAQTAKQVVLQRLREAERDLLYEEFAQHKEDIISGIVEYNEIGRAMSLDLGRAHATMPPDEQVPSERYKKGQRVKVYVLDVRTTPKGPEILVSRSHKDMLKRLFEIEVPEVYNGVVEIKSISREAGQRSKVAVHSEQEGIDAVGSCIGIRGNRIQSIVNELQGEKIDVVSWDPDPKTFIARAISPSEVLHVELESSEQTAVVVVPDKQLSLAIGKEGQNARLAARLAGWRLDIKGLAEWEEIQEAFLASKAAEELKVVTNDVTTEDHAESTELVTTDIGISDELSVSELETEDLSSLDDKGTAQMVGHVESELDEDALIEALIEEEESNQSQEGNQPEVASSGLSVEELADFTMDEVAEEFEDDLDGEVLEDVPSEISLLTPDAGKIRFAEDLIGEFRGPVRANRRAARRNTKGNNNRGPGSR
jgi:N utilization substance protein A